MYRLEMALHILQVGVRVGITGATRLLTPTDTILAQRAFYGQNYGFGWEILFTLSTQMLGYGIAGIMRKFLVEPGTVEPHVSCVMIHN